MNDQLEINEKIVFELRKHWWNISLVALFFLALVLLPLIFIFGITNNTVVEIPANISLFVWFVWSLWTLALWVLFAIKWTDYYLDVWIITDKRIIDIDQNGLFNRDIATVRIEAVQDIKVKIIGVLPTLLNLGDIELQTSGAGKEFEMREAYDPEHAKKIIQDIIEKKENEIKTVHIQP